MTQSAKISRRKFFGTVGLAGLGGGAYMRFWEPNWLRVGRHSIATGQNHPAINVLQLSDFHASSVVSLQQIDASIELGLSLKPDLICVTGDFITTRHEAFEEYTRILKRLQESAPTFACLGNHDGGRWIGRRGYTDTSLVRLMLSKAGITLLHNTSTQIQIKGRALTMVGVGDLWARELDADKAFADVSKHHNSTVVLLSHNPDSKSDVAAYPWHLMLCGHTHGGQLRLPLLGYPFAPVYDKRFVEGLHRWNDRWIYITRGVGNLHGLRFNCPPEVSLLTLS